MCLPPAPPCYPNCSHNLYFFSTEFGGLLVSYTPNALLWVLGFFWVVVFKLVGRVSGELIACDGKLELNIQLQSFSVVAYQQEL